MHAPHSLLVDPLSPIDQRIASVAARQRGMLTMRQLRACGLSTSAITKRVAAGRLHRIHPGVYAIGHCALDFEDRAMAAVLWSRRGVACGRTTARLFGFYDRGRSTIEVLSTTRLRPLDDVAVRFSRRVPERDITCVRGIATSTPARSIAELSDDLTRFQLANAIHEMRRLRLATREDVERVAAEHLHRRGHPVIAGALLLHDRGSSGTLSGAEDRALHLVQAAGFPEPLVNVRIRLGRRQCRIDLRWPELRLCVEIDGPEHDLPRQQRIDAERDAALRALGYQVIRIPVAFVEGIVEILEPYFA
ncbi:MAG: type IV toxin-antitoxin system AbiEi family antitoxin domain-containing protein [Thermoleophilia bacterium]|nr:type IV toxin-antitoxin system AbiEi family antitoxin domain-containing protein [Thermoleophilia bacterium]